MRIRIGSFSFQPRKAYIAGTLLLAFGYTPTVIGMLMAAVPTRQGSLLIKATIALVFFFLLPFLFTQRASALKPIAPILIMFALCAVRLLYDVLVRDILFIFQTPFYILSYFFGLTFLPVVALAGTARRNDVPQIQEWLFRALFLANILVLVFVGDIGYDGYWNLFSGRLQVAGLEDGTATLGPIEIGQNGACLALAALGRLSVFRHKSFGWTVGNVFSILIGCVNILLSASRGPALAFLVGILAVLISIVSQALGAIAPKIRRNALVYLSVPAVFVVLLASREDVPVFLFSRISSLFVERLAGDGVQEERDLIHAAALDDFSKSPLLGSSYAVSYERSSPHNIFYEALISAGIFGGIAIIVVIWSIIGDIQRVWRGELGPHGYPLALTAICLLVIQFTSGSIIQSPAFWVFVSMLALLVRSERDRTEGSGAQFDEMLRSAV
jgi:hypothetical protein